MNTSPMIFADFDQNTVGVKSLSPAQCKVCFRQIRGVTRALIGGGVYSYIQENKHGIGLDRNKIEPMGFRYQFSVPV